jgi:hypothetical protein
VGDGGWVDILPDNSPFPNIDGSTEYSIIGVLQDGQLQSANAVTGNGTIYPVVGDGGWIDIVSGGLPYPVIKDEVGQIILGFLKIDGYFDRVFGVTGDGTIYPVVGDGGWIDILPDNSPFPNIDGSTEYSIIGVLQDGQLQSANAVTGNGTIYPLVADGIVLDAGDGIVFDAGDGLSAGRNNLDNDPIGMLLDIPDEEFLSTLTEDQQECLRNAPGYMDEASVGISLARGLLAYSLCGDLDIFPEDVLLMFSNSLGMISDGEFVIVNGLDDDPIEIGLTVFGDGYYAGLSKDQQDCLINTPGYMEEASYEITQEMGNLFHSLCGPLGVYPEMTLLNFSDGFALIINGSFSIFNVFEGQNQWVQPNNENDLNDDTVGAGVESDGKSEDGNSSSPASFCGFPTELSNSQSACVEESLGQEVINGIRAPSNSECVAAKTSCFANN